MCCVQRVTMFQLWGPNLERLWQSVAPGRYMTSNIEQKESGTNHASWYNPLTQAGGIAKGLTRDMTREERQQFLDEHPVLRNWYMDDASVKDYLLARRLQVRRLLLEYSKWFVNSVFVSVAGKFVAKKTHGLARGA